MKKFEFTMSVQFEHKLPICNTTRTFNVSAKNRKEAEKKGIIIFKEMINKTFPEIVFSTFLDYIGRYNVYIWS